MYHSDLWLGFICEQIVRQTCQLSRLKCPGCEDKLKSPLLHQHEQLNLLEKLKLHFEDIRGSVLPSIPQLYAQIQDHLPHSDDLAKDQECYIMNARQFLLMLTSEALYFGRYQSEFLDGLVDDCFKVAKKRKTTVSQNPRKKV